ncbi:MAG: electron carrier [Thelocarpon superellum]|nr:MAG: electron carrier [Thelocarpon superellum]
MAPSVVLTDTASDLSTNAGLAGSRTLLLAPPSLSSHPEALNRVSAAHDRSMTDIQMLDRLSLGLVNLPSATYDLVLVLSAVDGTEQEATTLLGRESLSRIVQSMKPRAAIRSQDGILAQDPDSPTRREAVLAGLLWEGPKGMVKPASQAIQPVPLRFKKRAPAVDTVTPATAKRKSGELEQAKPRGVDFVDFSDDFDEPIMEGDDGEELIDENTLLDEEDLARPIIQPADCRPKSGKRRRACKDCTCGLKERLEKEDSSKRSAADQALQTLRLGANDLAEVDFTVEGQVGSCGSCALGDAFRCDGCPYIGLPAFKPGEEVRLLNNDVQL